MIPTELSERCFLLRAFLLLFSQGSWKKEGGNRIKMEEENGNRKEENENEEEGEESDREGDIERAPLNTRAVIRHFALSEEDYPVLVFFLLFFL